MTITLPHLAAKYDRSADESEGRQRIRMDVVAVCAFSLIGLAVTLIAIMIGVSVFDLGRILATAG
jgi:hypothetical protein